MAPHDYAKFTLIERCRLGPVLIGLLWTWACPIQAQECEGAIIRGSDAANGEQADFHALSGSVSSGEQYAPATTSASNILPGDDNDRQDVLLRNMDTGQVALVSVALESG